MTARIKAVWAAMSTTQKALVGPIVTIGTLLFVAGVAWQLRDTSTPIGAGIALLGLVALVVALLVTALMPAANAVAVPKPAAPPRLPSGAAGSSRIASRVCASVAVILAVAASALALTHVHAAPRDRDGNYRASADCGNLLVSNMFQLHQDEHARDELVSQENLRRAVQNDGPPEDYAPHASDACIDALNGRKPWAWTAVVLTLLAGAAAMVIRMSTGPKPKVNVT